MIDTIYESMKHYGVAEIAGEKNNDTIVSWAHEIGLDWINNDEIPWCAVFANMVLKRCGREWYSSALARDLTHLNAELKTPIKGCVCVFARDNSPILGHVGFFLADLGDTIEVISGNSNNRVQISHYDKSALIGCYYSIKLDET